MSFQANKRTPFIGWFKYKEGFAASLVGYVLKNLTHKPGVLLDPFAGTGTSLFAGMDLGWKTIGIELLPVGLFVTQARLAVKSINPKRFYEAVRAVLNEDFGKHYDEEHRLKHIPITAGAFPEETERQLAGYRKLIKKRFGREKDIFTLLDFAAFSVLEEISFTRKDGQYLRWDRRGARVQGAKDFNKGKIYTFPEMIGLRLPQMAADIADDLKDRQPSLFDLRLKKPEQVFEPELIAGSCLTVLPELSDHSVDFIMTSPPYCNRYDYTRTYALELVYLGCDAEQVKQLRQDLLSCTVENKEKTDQLCNFYTQRGQAVVFEEVLHTFNEQKALHEVLSILDRYAKEEKLNNTNIARMVRNYFLEMCFVIKELSRIVRPGATLVMVNDNVRYAGEEIPVDLILSDFAASFGLSIESIWTLSRGKGNSSQQMGHHGRFELRKCVYVWSKPVSG